MAFNNKLMKKNLLNDFVIHKINSVEQYLILYVTTKEPECLHKLRVDIKKIKAMYSFSNAVFKKKYRLGKLKDIFHKAGKIREIQIQLLQLELLLSPPRKIIKELKKKEASLILQFIKSLNQILKIINNFHKNSCLPDKLPNEKVIVNYFNKEKKSATKKLKNAERDELHKYRTKIKKLMYLYNFLPKKTQQEIQFNKVKIKNLQEQLGDWHDNYSTINYLSNLKLPTSASRQILHFKEKEVRQFNNLLNKLRKENLLVLQ
jgi:CHAD domain-containing protein